MSEIKRIRQITRVSGRRVGAGGRARLAAVLTATAVCGAVAVGAAPDASARPDPGGVSSCPDGYFATTAYESCAGNALPPGSNQGGAKPRDVGKNGPRGGRVQDQRNSSVIPLSGELVGTGCLKHTGGTATMQFRWSSPGPLDVGFFEYSLIDCTSGESHRRDLAYETGTSRTSDKAEATFKVNPSRKYRMRIDGQGTYHRDPRTQFEGLIGHFDIAPDTDAPRWESETPCV